MADRVSRVVSLSTGNPTCSIPAEGILRKGGAGCFNAFSARGRPKSAVNPFAPKVLASFDDPADGFCSKSWEGFAGPDALVMGVGLDTIALGTQLRKIGLSKGAASPHPSRA